MRADLHDYTTDTRRRLAERLEAASRRRGGSAWHEARARGLLARPERIARCGTEVAAVTRCGAGTARAVHRACGDHHACPRCAAARMRRHYARMLASVSASLRAPDARRRILRMLTLTVRHSGDLRADRARIARAWARHRAWLAARGIRARYWLVWECAPGSDGAGHVHAHVIVHAPWYRYADAVRAWHAHTDGWSVRYDCRTVRATRGRPTRDLQDAVRAVAYVAAYVSGGDEKALALAPTTHAEWWAASYGRRAVSAHRGAWTPYTPHCPCCGEVVVWYAPAYRRDATASLAELARALSAASAS